MNRKTGRETNRKMSRKRERASAPTAALLAFKTLLKPAMIGWTLKAFGTAAMLLIPLAALSALLETPPERRAGAVGAATLLFAAAWAIRQLGVFIRIRKKRRPPLEKR